MRAPNWQVAVVILVTTVLKCISALECNGSALLESQDDIEKKLGGCTIWIGSLQIGFHWNGPFVLSNITNITGSLTTNRQTYASTVPLNSSLTSVEAPALKSVDEVVLRDTRLLASISFPKLEQVRNFDFTLDSSLEPSTEVSINMPALITASSMYIIGNIPRLTLPNLVQIRESLYITNNRTREIESYNTGPLPAKAITSVTVDLPVLRQLYQVQIMGPISNLSMPSLETINEWDAEHRYHQYPSGLLLIHAIGQPLAVKLPALRNATNMSLFGNIKEVSFPALFEMNGSFILKSAMNTSYDSKPLRQVRTIELYGNVTSYNIDSLTSVERLTIDTPEGIDCNAANATWTRIHPDYNNSNHDYICKLKIKAVIPKQKIPFPALPVGLSIGIGVPVWLFFMFALWHSRKAKKQAEEVAKIPPPDYDAEMAARSAGGGEVLPDYEPRRSQGSGSQPGSVIELVDMSRPSPHPPGYDAATAASGAVVPMAVGSTQSRERVDRDPELHTGA